MPGAIAKDRNKSVLDRAINTAGMPLRSLERLRIMLSRRGNDKNPSRRKFRKNSRARQSATIDREINRQSRR